MTTNLIIFYWCGWTFTSVVGLTTMSYHVVETYVGVGIPSRADLSWELHIYCENGPVRAGHPYWCCSVLDGKTSLKDDKRSKILTNHACHSCKLATYCNKVLIYEIHYKQISLFSLFLQICIAYFLKSID